ncbi:hypothetical protein JHN52_28310 [Streptomyces sp. MBT97]|uniref:hypothetical protein n=1 Tax=Streptomyces sp. MBT97 TaxID=2800411 RepID=UPI00190A572B|nr:hypothetical protein [Streptomyces sp. MBT97]MBK3636738.1 hypothetical protein [Streptomyces sp. MBT97]
MHARVAADALDRLVADVRTGRGEWGHPQTVRQAVADLTRVSEALATAAQQMAAALDRERSAPGPAPNQAAAALREAGTAGTTAAHHLRRAHRAPGY